jgi:agmatinase
MVTDLEKVDAQVALIGVPYDFGTVVPGMRTGSSRSPLAVRNATTYYYTDRGTGEVAVGRYDINDDRMYLKGVTIADCGDVNIVAGADVGENFGRITEVVRTLVSRGAIVGAIGGDHSVSFPVGRGMEAHGDIDVVHFDAHADFRGRAQRLALVAREQPAPPLGTPVREEHLHRRVRVVTKKDHDDAVAYGCRIVTSRRMNEIGGAAAVDEVVPPAKKIYVSIDTDVLDSSIVPGTMLPEPEGISYRTLMQALWRVCEKGRVVGFDLVELSSHDHARARAHASRPGSSPTSSRASPRRARSRPSRKSGPAGTVSRPRSWACHRSAA